MNDIKSVERIIKSFLAKHTDHQAETAKVRKGRKSDYSCNVINKEGKTVNVAFWITKEMLSYGIIGWGIPSSVPLKSLENE